MGTLGGVGGAALPRASAACQSIVRQVVPQSADGREKPPVVNRVVTPLGLVQVTAPFPPEPAQQVSDA